jgi:Ca2+-binding EF-hand superfamily protein
MGDHSQDIIDGMVKSVLAQSIEHVVAYEIKHKNKLRKLTASKENEPALKFKYLPLSNAILKNKWSSILPNIRRSTFKRAIKKHKKQTVRGKIGRTFDKLDLNLDGHLTVAEIKRALTLNSTSLNLSQFPILSQIFRPRYLSWALHRIFEENAITREAFIDFVEKLRREEGERNALSQIFAFIDVDSSNTLSIKEIKKALMLNAAELLPMTVHFPPLHKVLSNPTKLGDSLANIGLGNQHEMDFEEFYKLVLNLRAEEEERLAILRVFKAMDRNDDGRLSEEEVLYMIVIKSDKIEPLLRPYPVLKTILLPKNLKGTFHKYAEGGEITAGKFIKMIQIARYEFEERKCLQSIFNRLDRDKNGEVTIKEAKRVITLEYDTIKPFLDKFPLLQDLMKPRKIAQEMAAADVDEKGHFTERDFIVLIQKSRKQHEEKITLQKMFDLLDKDGDGSLTMGEIRRGLTLSYDLIASMLTKFPLLRELLKPKSLRKMFNEVKPGNNGEMTREEFSKYVKSIREKHEEKEALLNLFMILDEDGSDDLTVREIKRGLMLNSGEINPILKHFPTLRAALKPKHLPRLFFLVDKRDSESITARDFLKLVEHIRQEHAETMAFQKVFQCIDMDGDEILTLKEIKRAFMMNAFEISSLLEPFPELRAVLRPKHFNLACRRYNLNSKSELALNEFRDFVQALKKEYLEKLALVEIFKVIDSSGDGMVSRTEIQRALLLKSKEFAPLLKLFPILKKAIGSQKEVDALFDKADKDRSGELSADEFQNLIWILRAEVAEKQALRHIFAFIDKDKNGSLSKRELKRAITLGAYEINSFLKDFRVLKSVLMKPKMIDTMFQEIDVNNDKSIDFDEFYDYVFVLRKRCAFNKCLESIFAVIDEDSSGLVTRRELQNALVAKMESILPLTLEYPSVTQIIEKPSRIMKYFEEADQDQSGEIDGAEFGAIIKAVMERGDIEEDDVVEEEEIRIITIEEEALLNVWNIISNYSDEELSKREVLKLVEGNFKARRTLRKIDETFETALRQKHFTSAIASWNAPCYAESFWLRQKQLKFGKIGQNDFILCGLQAYDTYKRKTTAKKYLNLVIMVQSMCRGWVQRKRRRKHTSAVAIQRVFRGFAARFKLWRERREKAAVVIQRIYRGARDRALVTRIFSAREIQRVYRGHLGRVKVQIIKDKRASYGF